MADNEEPGLEEYGDVIYDLLEDGELVAGGNDHLVQLRVVVGIDGSHPPASLQHRMKTISAPCCRPASWTIWRSRWPITHIAAMGLERALLRLV